LLKIFQYQRSFGGLFLMRICALRENKKNNNGWVVSAKSDGREMRAEKAQLEEWRQREQLVVENIGLS